MEFNSRWWIYELNHEFPFCSGKVYSAIQKSMEKEDGGGSKNRSLGWTLDKIGHVAEAPGPLACHSRGARPPSLS